MGGITRGQQTVWPEREQPYFPGVGGGSSNWITNRTAGRPGWAAVCP